ncbi:MAG: porin [Bacteriovoracaceae bacterium]|nr:porin [Bacteriovoracaceae bacterium]
MKLVLLTLVAALCLNTAFAGPKIFGKMKASINSTSVGEGDAADKSVAFKNNDSYIGFMGKIKLRRGFKAFYKAYFNFAMDGVGFASNEAYMGFKGKWGTFQLGQMDLPYALAASEIDPFFNTSAARYQFAAAATTWNGAAYGLSGYSQATMTNSMAYYSPTFYGMHIALHSAIDNGTGDKHSYNAALFYDAHDIMAAFNYLLDNPNDTTAIAATLGYTIKGFGFGFSYESITVGEGDAMPYIYGNLSYSYKKKHKLAVSYGNLKDVGAAIDGTGFNVGYFHNYGKNTAVSLIYSSVDYKLAATPDISTIAAGFEVMF